MYFDSKLLSKSISKEKECLDDIKNKYAKVFLFQNIWSLELLYEKITGMEDVSKLDYNAEIVKLMQKKEDIGNENNYMFYKKNLEYIDNMSRSIVLMNKDDNYNESIFKEKIDGKLFEDYIFSFLSSINYEYQKKIEGIWNTNVGFVNSNITGYSILNYKDFNPYIVLNNPLYNYNNLFVIIHELGHIYENYLCMDKSIRKRVDRFYNLFGEVSSSTFEHLFIDYLKSVDKNISQMYQEKNDRRLIEWMKRIHLAISLLPEIDKNGYLYFTYKDAENQEKIDSVKYNKMDRYYSLYSCIDYGFSNIIARNIKGLSTENINKVLIKNNFDKEFRFYTEKEFQKIIKKG